MHWAVDVQKHCVGKGYSQDGEEFGLEYIFQNIGTTNKLAVDIGAADGKRQSNTFHLKYKLEFERLLLDINPTAPDVLKYDVTPTNINQILVDHKIPVVFDMLNIDIDGNDYWVWKAIRHFPRVVVMEYNHSLGFIVSKTIKYNPNHTFNRNQYFGASAVALVKLGVEKGYKVVARTNTNLIFVQETLVRHAPKIRFPPNESITRGWGPAPEGSIWVEV